MDIYSGGEKWEIARQIANTKMVILFCFQTKTNLMCLAFFLIHNNLYLVLWNSEIYETCLNIRNQYFLLTCVEEKARMF